MNNPKVKKGDIIVVKQCNNGSTPVNIPLIVQSFSSGQGNFTVKYEGRIYTVFNTDPADVYVFADKNAQIEHLKEYIKDLKTSLSNKEKELNHLLLYETEEDFVATKLEELLTAHKQNNSPADRIKLMSEILKTMKDSHLI